MVYVVFVTALGWFCSPELVCLILLVLFLFLHVLVFFNVSSSVCVKFVLELVSLLLPVKGFTFRQPFLLHYTAAVRYSHGRALAILFLNLLASSLASVNSLTFTLNSRNRWGERERDKNDCLSQISQILDIHVLTLYVQTEHH